MANAYVKKGKTVHVIYLGFQKAFLGGGGRGGAVAGGGGRGSHQAKETQNNWHTMEL